MQTPGYEIIIVALLVCTIGATTLVSFAVMFLYRHKLILLDHWKTIEKIKQFNESRLLKSQIEIQEQTFQNISREIHDNINQILTLAKFHLRSLNVDYEENECKLIESSIELIGEAINDLTDISRSLSSDLIRNNGLIKALEFEVDRVNNSTKFEVKLEIWGNSRFIEAETEIIIFRIIQEALSNAIRHSNGNVFLIMLKFTNNDLQLEMLDNGVGFDFTKIRNESTNSSGLNNMFKRVEFLNGEFIIDSNIGNGTLIKASIPIC
ncbi:MAG: hypothetical protein C5B52_16290 [Bacteroidetes bacterium]|nr:MAG: hypothetical protein C5B52_16290 [Bacteroidota bacterium]